MVSFLWDFSENLWIRISHEFPRAGISDWNERPYMDSLENKLHHLRYSMEWESGKKKNSRYAASHEVGKRAVLGI
jgi:hypothetical protein